MSLQGDVAHLADLKADLSRIPAHKISIKRGEDGLRYYSLDYQIQITHYSASTTYELIHDGVNFGEVSAQLI